MIRASECFSIPLVLTIRSIRQALALDGRLDKTQHDCMTRPPSER